VYDYGLSIKTNDFPTIRKNLVRVYGLLVMMGSPEYEKNVLLQLLKLRWLESVEHPCLQVLSENPHLFNNEDVELANSHMSRMSVGNSMRSHIADVEKLYILLPAYRRCVKNATGMKTKDSYHAVLSPESWEVEKCVETLKTLSSSVKDGTWIPYRNVSGKSNWGSKEHEEKSREWNAHTRRIAKNDEHFANKLNKNLLKLKQGLKLAPANSGAGRVRRHGSAPAEETHSDIPDQSSDDVGEPAEIEDEVPNVGATEADETDIRNARKEPPTTGVPRSLATSGDDDDGQDDDDDAVGYQSDAMSDGNKPQSEESAEEESGDDLNNADKGKSNIHHALPAATEPGKMSKPHIHPSL
jgi:hypothetical protein